MRKIILTGYMGSGKTTVARLLYNKTGLKTMDLDEILEQKMQMSIAEIFDAKGEIYFRKLEHEIFRELMHSPDSFVLSIGGGTPCYANSHELLNGKDIVSIYLRASIDTLFGRLAKDGGKRPVIAGKDPESIREFIAKHLFDRGHYYNQATFKVDTNGKTPEAVALEIEKLLA